jgi:hypothetical protein
MVVRSLISFGRSLFAFLRRAIACDRRGKSFVGHAGVMAGRVDVVGRHACARGRTVREIAGRGNVFRRQHDPSGRFVVFVARCGDRFRRRDPHFRRRAHFVGTRV